MPGPILTSYKVTAKALICSDDDCFTGKRCPYYCGGFMINGLLLSFRNLRNLFLDINNNCKFE